MTNPRNVLAVVAALGLGACLTAAVFSQTPDISDALRKLTPEQRLELAQKMEAREEVFSKARRGDLVHTIVERATIEPAQTTEIVCRLKAKDKNGVSGTIQFVVEDGAIVKAGDKLVEINAADLEETRKAQHENVVKITKSRDLQAAILRLTDQEAKAEERLAALAIRLAETELKRYKGNDANEKDNLELKVAKARIDAERIEARGRAKVLQDEGKLATLLGALKVEHERLQAIDRQLTHRILTAPRDGYVVHHVPSASRFGTAASLVAVGEPVREGQTLLNLVDLKQFVAKTNVHEAMIARVKGDQAATVRVDAFPKRIFEAKVKTVATTASKAQFPTQGVRIYAVTVALEDAPPNLRPGMSAEIRITTGSRKDVLQVPATALLGVGKNRFCYVRTETGLEERPVQIGFVAADGAEVTSGLKEGEEVLSDPHRLVRPPKAK